MLLSGAGPGCGHDPQPMRTERQESSHVHFTSCMGWMCFSYLDGTLKLEIFNSPHMIELSDGDITPFTNRPFVHR